MVNKSGFISGILSLIVLMISEIPIYLPQNLVLKLYLYTYNDISFYVWGYVLNNSESYSFLSLSYPENLISFSIWLIFLLLTITSIMASPKNSNPSNSIRIYSINIILIIMLLIIYAIQLVFIYLNEIGLLFSNIGVGYYLMGIILILNIIAKKNLKKKK